MRIEGSPFEGHPPFGLWRVRQNPSPPTRTKVALTGAMMLGAARRLGCRARRWSSRGPRRTASLSTGVVTKAKSYSSTSGQHGAVRAARRCRTSRTTKPITTAVSTWSRSAWTTTWKAWMPSSRSGRTPLDRAARCRGTSRHGQVTTYYGVFSIPQTILVGRDGKVVSVGVRRAAWRGTEEAAGPAEKKIRWCANQPGTDRQNPRATSKTPLLRKEAL